MNKVSERIPSAGRRRIVIVNADDFGASHRTNMAILQSFQKNLISSATIMANMPSFDEACELTQQHALGQSIGLHINLTLGRPLTHQAGLCQTLCSPDGCWRPARKLPPFTSEEESALETEIEAQFLACVARGITPTHMDSHNHIHTQPAVLNVVIRLAERLGVRAVRLKRNCGPMREGVSLAYRLLAKTDRLLRNRQLIFHGLAGTRYFGDVRDAIDVVRTTTDDVEVMVHPRLDDSGRLVDIDGEDLATKIASLELMPDEKCSYFCGASVKTDKYMRASSNATKS